MVLVTACSSSVDMMRRYAFVRKQSELCDFACTRLLSLVYSQNGPMYLEYISSACRSITLKGCSINEILVSWFSIALHGFGSVSQTFK